MTVRGKRNLIQDCIVLVLSISVAVLLARSGMLENAVRATADFAFLEMFAAGMLFTSAFTTPLAIAVLGKIAEEHSAFLTALVGASGSLLGDLIIFRFIRDRLADDLMALIGKKGAAKFAHIVHQRIFRWFSPFVAALIIASPLPDELAVTILGLEKIKTGRFALFSYAANFTGILILGTVARAVA